MGLTREQRDDIRERFLRSRRVSVRPLASARACASRLPEPRLATLRTIIIRPLP